MIQGIDIDFDESGEPYIKEPEKDIPRCFVSCKHVSYRQEEGFKQLWCDIADEPVFALYHKKGCPKDKWFVVDWRTGKGNPYDKDILAGHRDDGSNPETQLNDSTGGAYRNRWSDKRTDKPFVQAA